MIYVLYDKPKKLEDMSFLTAAFEKEYKEIYPEWRCTSIKQMFSRGMDFLAKYTMPIFLMHTLFAAPLRSVLLKVGVTNSVAHVVLGLGISFAGPIIAAWIMKKTKWMEFFLYPNKLIRKVS